MSHPTKVINQGIVLADLPVLGTDATNKTYVDTNINTALITAAPPGAVSYFATTTAPSGWLKANGAVLAITSYQSLFNALPKQSNGNTIWWLPGDGPTNFRLPDLRGIFVRGYDDSRGINPDGQTFGVYQGDSFASHTHGVNDPSHAHSVYDPGHAHNFVFTQGDDNLMAAYGWAGSVGVSVPGYFGHPHELEQAGVPQGSRLGYFWGVTQYRGTGVGVYGAYTGISIQYSGESETRPKYAALLACIKY